MHADKIIQFRKRWLSLEAERKDIEYRRSVWCRDCRSEFDAGKAGDLAFGKFCATEFGLTAGQLGELLDRARSLSVIPDEKTWTLLGGYRAVRHLYPLPRKEQVQVIEAVKATGKAVRTIISERRLGVSPIARRSSQPQKRDTAERIDAEILAAYILRSVQNAPRHIVKIAQRYAAQPRALKAVA